MYVPVYNCGTFLGNVSLDPLLRGRVSELRTPLALRRLLSTYEAMRELQISQCHHGVKVNGLRLRPYDFGLPDDEMDPLLASLRQATPNASPVANQLWCAPRADTGDPAMICDQFPNLQGHHWPLLDTPMGTADVNFLVSVIATDVERQAVLSAAIVNPDDDIFVCREQERHERQTILIHGVPFTLGQVAAATSFGQDLWYQHDRIFENVDENDVHGRRLEGVRLVFRNEEVACAFIDSEKSVERVSEQVQKSRSSSGLLFPNNLFLVFAFKNHFLETVRHASPHTTALLIIAAACAFRLRGSIWNALKHLTFCI